MPKTIIVENKTERPLGIMSSGHEGGTKFLIPGNNSLDETYWLEAKKNKIVVEMLERDMLSESTAKVSSKAKSDEGLGMYGVKDAKAIIQSTYDVKTLKDWESKEGRNGVRAALKNQIEFMKQRDKKEEKKDDEKDS